MSSPAALQATIGLRHAPACIFAAPQPRQRSVHLQPRLLDAQIAYQAIPEAWVRGNEHQSGYGRPGGGSGDLQQRLHSV